MELTYRQRVFLNKLLDAYLERKEPVHYSVMAKRLGLNNSTAYDMLRLLEQKGMVASEYITPKETSGPGRANIRFFPTNEAMEVFSHLAGDIREQDEWDDVKARILVNLRKGKADDYKDILKEITAKIPEQSSPLVRCAEVITALLLNLRAAKQELTEQSSVDVLLKAPASKLRMSILSGLILGLSNANQRTQRLVGRYEEYAEKYQAALQELNQNNLVKLHRFTRDVWNILKKPAH